MEFKTNWVDFCYDNEDEIKKNIAEMIFNTDRFEQDLYFYNDGTITVFENIGGNSWLDDDHVCFFSYGQGWYVDYIEEMRASGADDDFIRDECVYNDFEALIVKARNYDKEQFEEV